MNVKMYIPFLLVACVVSIAAAGSIELTPNPADLYDLEHAHYYTWGIHYTEIDPTADLADIIITGATLSFENIRNHNSSDNDLWVHLLDDAPLGVTAAWDSYPGQYDHFFGQGELLEHFEDLPATPQDKTIVFENYEVGKLNLYLQNDGIFALGFDPDCHFYNDGVTLTLEYDVTPEPTTLALLGSGLLFLRRRRK
jgi:hypothetical protein